MRMEGEVGPRALADGTSVAVRQDRTGAIVTTQSGGDYAEAVLRSQIFSACTGVAGVAPGTALSTTPPFSLWNPNASGRIIYVVRISVGYISGTLGAGTLLVGAVPQQVAQPATGTQLTVMSNYLSNAPGAARAFQGSTLVAAPTPIRPVMILGAATAAQAAFPAPAEIRVDGDIAIPPGSVLALQAVAAAGTSPLLMLSMTWIEIPALTVAG